MSPQANSTTDLSTRPQHPADFASLAISQDLKTVVAELGFEKMTQIQAQSIPILLEGKDLIGQSKTGSGKTAAFGLPILEKLNIESRDVQALILCPTRELCTQVAREIRRLGRRYQGLQVLIVCGGLPGRPQADALRKGVHIVVGTPGRVLDHLQRRQMTLGYISTLVLDEADRMLDMGFEEEMAMIMDEAPSTRQTVFFSATFPKIIASMSSHYQQNPVHVTIDDSKEKPLIQQLVYDAEQEDKLPVLMKVLKKHPSNSTIIFCNQKNTVATIDQALQAQGLSSSSLHGDLEQVDRDRVLAMFRNGSRRILVATDVAARGLDIANLDLVVQFDLPHDVDSYIHRIGRTGRAGKEGVAIAIASANQRMRLYEFAKETGKTCEAGDLADVQVNATAAASTAAAMQTLWISAGRKEKVRPTDILGALTGEAGGYPGSEIGKIEIHDHFSYVAVSANIARTAVTKLQNGRIKGRKFLIRIV